MVWCVMPCCNLDPTTRYKRKDENDAPTFVNVSLALWSDTSSRGEEARITKARARVKRLLGERVQ